jgi:hypothetical protein
MMDWQPIETAPKDGTNVLLYATWMDISVGKFYRDERWRLTADGFLAKESEGDTYTEYFEVAPTHWMPLPPKPITK